MSGIVTDGLPLRVKSALLWGVTGALAFLALVQGYALLVSSLVTTAQGIGLALLVGIVAAGGAYLLEHRIAAWATQRVTQ